MLKILTLFGAIFVAVFSVGLLVAAWPMLPLMALILIGLGLLFAVTGGSILLYYWLGKARLINAQALATTLEAAKVPDNVQALALPVGRRLDVALLPGRPAHLALSAPAGSGLTDAVADAGLPEAPALADLLDNGFVPTQKKMLLGYSLAGPLYGTISDLLSVAVAGRPGQGKSSLLRFIYAQVILAGGQVFNLDPHGSILEDVAGAPSLWSASTGRELDEAAGSIVTELEKRLEAYRAGKRDFRLVMGLVDEFPVIALSSKKAVAAISRIVLEGRKVKIFCLISGQGLPASQFGGSLVRDALSSRYIFKTTTRQGQLAGLDRDAWAMLETLDTGRAVFEGPIKATILAIPKTVGADLVRLTARPAAASFVQQTPNQKSASPGPASASVWPSSAASSTDGPGSAVTGSNSEPEKTVTADYRVLPAAPDELLRAYAAWRSGNNSVRKLQSVLGVTKYQAEKLVNELRAQGLI